MFCWIDRKLLLIFKEGRRSVSKFVLFEHVRYLLCRNRKLRVIIDAFHRKRFAGRIAVHGVGVTSQFCKLAVKLYLKRKAEWTC